MSWESAASPLSRASRHIDTSAVSPQIKGPQQLTAPHGCSRPRLFPRTFIPLLLHLNLKKRRDALRFFSGCFAAYLSLVCILRPSGRTGTPSAMCPSSRITPCRARVSNCLVGRRQGQLGSGAISNNRGPQPGFPSFPLSLGPKTPTGSHWKC